MPKAAAVLLVVLLAPTAATQAPATGFHHLHLNSVDPAKAIDWYAKTFPVTTRTTLAGFEGLASEKIYLLFARVPAPPHTSPHTAIWHFGWGSPDMPGDFAMHQADGVTFATPLSTLPGGTAFAYMKAPDEAMVEINSAQSRAFVHVHLYSEAPLCAADWYERHLGGTRRGTRPAGPCDVPFGAPSEPLAVVRTPAATVRFDDISLIIYPRQRPGPLAPSRGHVVDHIALSVSDLTGTLARLQAAGVKVLRGVHAFGNGSTLQGPQGRPASRGAAIAALIEGPDSIAIELVERP